MIINKSVMRLRVVIVIGIIIVAIVSYLYAPTIYAFYLSLYYNTIRKETEQSLVEKIAHSYNQKDYAALARYCEHGSVLYPANREIKKYMGLYLLSRNDVRGAFLLLALGELPNEVDQLEAIVIALDAHGSYKEIIEVVKKKGAQTPNLKYYYGKALHALGHYKTSRDVLLAAYTSGVTQSDYYIGANYHALKDFKNALVWYKKALAREPSNPTYIKALATIYTQMGDFAQAQRYILRLRK